MNDGLIPYLFRLHSTEKLALIDWMKDSHLLRPGEISIVAWHRVCRLSRQEQEELYARYLLERKD